MLHFLYSNFIVVKLNDDDNFFAKSTRQKIAFLFYFQEVLKDFYRKEINRFTI